MRALVLSGGASKGAYQVGVLKHLLGNLEIKYDIIGGISVGAINAAYLGMHKHGQEKQCIKNLEILWRQLTTDQIYVPWLNWPGALKYLSYIYALFKSSLYNSQPLREFIEKHYDPELIANSGKRLQVGAVSLNTGEYRIFAEDFPQMVDAILASSSFPAAFCPIEIDGQLWTDGGVKEITPLKSVIKAGATEIDVIVTSPKDSIKTEFNKTPSLLQLGPRIIDIMSGEIMANDLSRALEINKLIKRGATIPRKKYIPIRIFRPKVKLVESSLEFEQKFINPMIKIGYEDALNHPET